MSGHVHRAASWDGYYEHCRCGASAGDRFNAHGQRMITFAEWDELARAEIIAEVIDEVSDPPVAAALDRATEPDED